MKKCMYCLLIVTLFVVLTGCATLTYESSDGTKVTYSRLFTTASNIEAEVGKAKLKMGGQKIDTATLQYLIKMLSVP